jgi:glycosyltransferase involved in cell wall biosynthesis
MKVLIDILGSTKESGGMRLHATEVILAWARVYPADELIVIGPKWASETFRDNRTISVRRWPNERVASRAIGQLIYTAVQAVLVRPVRVVSLSPIVSPFVPSKYAVCFEHDWRHKKVPAEFGVAQQLYRKLWDISAARAGTVVCISEKARDETLSHVSGARVVVIANGRDHAGRWKNARSRDSEQRTIVTFGHHNNKRPELVIDAFARMLDRQVQDLTLIVLGAKGQYRSALHERTERLGIARFVKFPGFVSREDYEEIVSSANAVVMASSDEGFGLPVVEAQYFGIPVIVTTDSGLADIHGDSVRTADATASALELALESALLDGRMDVALNSGKNSWDDTAKSLRAVVLAGSHRTRAQSSVDG